MQGKTQGHPSGRLFISYFLAEVEGIIGVRRQLPLCAGDGIRKNRICSVATFVSGSIKILSNCDRRQLFEQARRQVRRSCVNGFGELASCGALRRDIKFPDASADWTGTAECVKKLPNRRAGPVSSGCRWCCGCRGFGARSSTATASNDYSKAKNDCEECEPVSRGLSQRNDSRPSRHLILLA